MSGDIIYNQKPNRGGKKVNGKRQYDEDEEDDTEIIDMKTLKKQQKNPNANAINAVEKVIKKPLAKKNPNPALPKGKKIQDKEIQESQTEEFVDVDETKQPATLVFIGHVDAGKSTISGNIMFLMGIVDQRTIQKYKEEAKEKGRDSWWLAYAMDISEEEKAKGKTVEIGRACFDLPQKRITIFDAPGHKNYVPNMIQGAAQADYGALVISAKRGEFESGFDLDGQTREHIQLAKSLGIQKLIIVINKMDESTVKWGKERYTEIQTSLTPFVAKCGYDPEKDVTWIPVSGLNGDNIKDVVSPTTCNWYKGPSLIDIINDLELPQRDPKGPIRIPILDKMKDRGVVIFGKVEQGTVNIGEKLTLMPSNASCQVAMIYNSKEQPVRYAKPGENVKIRLLHIGDENLVNKGDVLCNRESPMPVTDLFEAELEILELLSYKPILSKGYQFVLHIHTVADDAFIKDIMVSYEKNDKGEVTEKLKPQFAMSNARIICRIATRIPICMEKHDVINQMGRFTLRDEGKTIALGKILKYKPAKLSAQPVAAVVASTESKEESKTAVNEDGSVQINTSSAEEKKVAQELIYDIESGETLTREEYNRRQKAQEMDQINEDEEYGEEEEEEEEEEGVT